MYYTAPSSKSLALQDYFMAYHKKVRKTRFMNKKSLTGSAVRGGSEQLLSKNGVAACADK